MSLDLEDISFGSKTMATYSGTSTSGVLTVADGSHVAKITLEGDYLASTFTVSSDGHGGTTVVDPPAASIASASAAMTDARSASGCDELTSRVRYSRHACVAQNGDRMIARPLENRARNLDGVLLAIAVDRLPADAVSCEQTSRNAGIFSDDRIASRERIERAQGDVAQISDRRRNENQGHFAQIPRVRNSAGGRCENAGRLRPPRGRLPERRRRNSGCDNAPVNLAPKPAAWRPRREKNREPTSAR